MIVGIMGVKPVLMQEKKHLTNTTGIARNPSLRVSLLPRRCERSEAIQAFKGKNKHTKAWIASLRSQRRSSVPATTACARNDDGVEYCNQLNTRRIEIIQIRLA